ncbi:radical SAM protein [Methanobrevibacter sp.]|uniref:radical SAM protein n=1 Tax=Methanobrevibacter sp. TaxID=66852 RepID=UPI003863089E
MHDVNVSKISRLRINSEGDGISTLIGFMGCPLRCAYCFNPFTWDDSLKPKKYSIDELYDEVKLDNLYFLATGGGLVFGGGEPLLYSDFIKEFIKKYAKTGWKFTLETSLSVKKEYLENIIRCIDYFIVDTKDMDKTRYELYTKGDYNLFLSNLKYLLETVGSDKIRVRVPKIPKLNTYANVRSNYEILKSMGFSEIEIFDYIEIDKHEKISGIALKNKQDFIDVVNNNFIKDYIMTEIIIKIASLLDFHIKNFPEELWKDIEFIFEYDSSYEEDLYSLKELIVSKLRECYDYLGLEYSFYVILKPFDYLKTSSDVDFDEKINFFIGLKEKDKKEFLLKSWEENKYDYLKFKDYCHKTGQLGEYYANYTYKPDVKYILSRSYDIDQVEFRIYLNLSGKKYNIVEYDDATHVLVQKFDNMMELIYQEIYSLKH